VSQNERINNVANNYTLTQILEDDCGTTGGVYILMMGCTLLRAVLSAYA